MRNLDSNIKSVYLKLVLAFLSAVSILIVATLSYEWNVATYIFLLVLIFISLFISIIYVIRNHFNRVSGEMRTQERISSAIIGLLHSTNGISSLKTYNELICDNLDNTEFIRELLSLEGQVIDEYSSKTKSIVSDLSDSFKYDKQKTDVGKLIQQSVDFIKAKRIRDKKIKIELNLPEEPLYAEISPSEMKTAFENILDNSFDELSDSENANKKNEQIEIIICDFGEGISGYDGNVPLNYFKPGKFSKKEGNGLGMYVTINTVKNNNGTISFESSNRGLKTTIKIRSI